jgi:hypothetical protein
MGLRIMAYRGLEVVDDYVAEPKTGPAGNGIEAITTKSFSLRRGLTPIDVSTGLTIDPKGSRRTVPIPELGNLLQWDIPGAKTTVFVFSTRKVDTSGHL